VPRLPPTPAELDDLQLRFAIAAEYERLMRLYDPPLIEARRILSLAEEFKRRRATVH